MATANAPGFLLPLPGAAHRQAVHAVVVVRVGGVAWWNWGEVVKDQSFLLFEMEDFAGCREGIFHFAKSLTAGHVFSLFPTSYQFGEKMVIENKACTHRYT